MKTAYLALGLIMTGYASAATMEGSIGVTLTIVSRCSVDGQWRPGAVQPAISCSQQREAQPKVTQTVMMAASVVRDEQRLVTVEW